MLATLAKVANAPKALRFVLIFAAVSLMTVPAGIFVPDANTATTVIGAGVAVTALATINAAADTFTVLLLLVVMFGAGVVGFLTAVDVTATCEDVVVAGIIVLFTVVMGVMTCP